MHWKLNYRIGAAGLLTVLLASSLCTEGAPENRIHINGYANIIIPDANSDTYQIGPALRDFAQKCGLTVYVNSNDVSETDAVKTCYAAWGWEQVGVATGTLHMRLHDAISGTLIAEVHSKATAYWTAGRAVKALVQKAFDQSGLTRYSAEQHRKNFELLFPPRPKVDISEKEFKSTTPNSSIEGLWADQDNKYNIAIMKAPSSMDFDYIGVIVSTASPVWSKGEIKMEIKNTATPGSFVGNYYPANKKRAGTMFTLEKEGNLTFSFSAGPNGEPTPTTFVKSWPVSAPTTISGPARPENSTSTSTGTGFLISTDGLVATNWHVIEGATVINLEFPEQRLIMRARIAIKDAGNDLAILKLTDSDSRVSPCTTLPYEIKKASAVALGKRVSTIGFPLDGVLGVGPKYTEGSISALTGLKDDIRSLQISAPIQPGNSGSPLFNEAGDVIGIVVSTLTPAFQYKMTETLPQNINFAIKADYLLSLMDMLPEKPTIAVSKASDIAAASKCVAVVRATKQ